MKTPRQILTIAVGVLGVFGFIMASVPFVSSMKPSAKARAGHAAWNDPPLSSLISGQVVLRQGDTSFRRENSDGSWSPIWGQRDLLIRDFNGTYYSYRLPTWKGAVVVPRISWGQWEGECREFGPATAGGLLLAITTIQCNDVDSGNWPTKNAKWAIDGKSLVEPYPDLPKLRCRKVAGGEPECI